MRKKQRKEKEKRRKTVVMADLFAGAGGTSTGAVRACKKIGVKVNLTAINHWPQALETHKANHPFAKHICSTVEALDPREVVPGGRLDLLVAAPECTHHSSARGGRPVLDQKRASGWAILRWLELLQVEALLVENVPEYQSWGPLGRRGLPLKRRKGETYNAWLTAIKSLGYTVEARVLNAADHGDATKRKRLFVLARRGRKPIVWPEPTHSKTGGSGLKKWRAAREIIDWSIVSRSIFGRKKPLAKATMRRIIAGLERFGGPELKPFLVILRGTGTVRSVDEPAPTITAQGNHIGLAEPFILPPEGYYRGNQPRSTGSPLQTITRRGGGHLVQPFILSMASGGAPRSTEEPAPTFVGKGGGFLVEAEVRNAFVMATGGPTGQMQPSSIDAPLRAVIPNNRLNVFQAFIVPQFGEALGQKPRTHSVEDPLPAPTSHGAGALVQPYMVQYNGQSKAHSIDAPVPTLSTHDRLGLVQPVVEGRALDIHFRMLQPHELAGAMGFGGDYTFTGTKQEVVKQIGNAVACHIAEALCASLLTSQTSLKRWHS